MLRDIGRTLECVKAIGDFKVGDEGDVVDAWEGAVVIDNEEFGIVEATECFREIHRMKDSFPDLHRVKWWRLHVPAGIVYVFDESLVNKKLTNINGGLLAAMKTLHTLGGVATVEWRLEDDTYSHIISKAAQADKDGVMYKLFRHSEIGWVEIGIADMDSNDESYSIVEYEVNWDKVPRGTPCSFSDGEKGRPGAFLGETIGGMFVDTTGVMWRECKLDMGVEIKEEWMIEAAENGR